MLQTGELGYPVGDDPCVWAA